MGDPLQVAGGAGGTAADLDAMTGTASVLAVSGVELLEAGVRAAGVAADPELAPGALVDPVGYAEVQQALGPLAVRLHLQGARAAALGEAVQVAAVSYAATEAATERLVVTARDALAARVARLGARAATSPWAWLALAAPVLGWITVRTVPLLVEEEERALADIAAGRFSLDSLDDRLLRLSLRQGEVLSNDARAAAAAAVAWAVAHPGASQQLVGALPATVPAPELDAEQLALVIGLLATAPLPSARSTEVDVRPAAAPIAAAAPTGVRDLLARAGRFAPPTDPMVGATPSGYAPGRIRVDRLEGARGTSWVVTVPPTQTWSMTSRQSPFDGASNLRLMTGLPAASSRATVEAMSAAGVRPGQPVMLVGYSQGGLTAMQVASDPVVRQRFAVTSVLTAGAPAGGFQPPGDVQVLSLEHRQDLVVAADGKDNPDDPAWTTVRRDLLSGSGAGAGVAAELPERPWAAHHLTPYLGTAAMVDVSTDESVRAWMRSAAPFWAAPGTTATTTEYAASRD